MSKAELTATLQCIREAIRLATWVAGEGLLPNGLPDPADFLCDYTDAIGDDDDWEGLSDRICGEIVAAFASKDARIAELEVWREAALKAGVCEACHGKGVSSNQP